jgi:hypothetical protein
MIDACSSSVPFGVIRISSSGQTLADQIYIYIPNQDQTTYITDLAVFIFVLFAPAGCISLGDIFPLFGWKFSNIGYSLLFDRCLLHLYSIRFCACIRTNTTHRYIFIIYRTKKQLGRFWLLKNVMYVSVSKYFKGKQPFYLDTLWSQEQPTQNKERFSSSPVQKHESNPKLNDTHSFFCSYFFYWFQDKAWCVTASRAWMWSMGKQRQGS